MRRPTEFESRIKIVKILAFVGIVLAVINARFFTGLGDLQVLMIVLQALVLLLASFARPKEP